MIRTNDNLRDIAKTAPNVALFEALLSIKSLIEQHMEREEEMREK